MRNDCSNLQQYNIDITDKLHDHLTLMTILLCKKNTPRLKIQYNNGDN